jgi:SAM-dependent methyltransferase
LMPIARRSCVPGHECARREYELHARAFDELASEYDAAFTESAIGKALRSMVWARFEQAFRGPSRVLELGCGTGEDALCLARRGLEVVAVDASSRMIQVARQKAGDAERLEFHCLAMERLGPTSNFGAVNCVADLPALAADVAARLRPGAPLVWVVMGRHVPWEWLWYLAHGQWKKAWRRLSRGGVHWRGLTIHYPTPAELAAVLRPHFEVRRIAPLGVALPPSYAGQWLERRPRLLRLLTHLEHLAQPWGALASVSDHYIVEAIRLPVDSRP